MLLHCLFASAEFPVSIKKQSVLCIIWTSISASGCSYNCT
uniref:Uncharacterized protein n=1 Tax=Arundo donax TaxID=35708 RepID=A0A0A8ZB93_ARUDO